VSDDLQAVGERIERLLDGLRFAIIPREYEHVEEVVRLVTELYGAGLERMLAMAGPDLVPRLVAFSCKVPRRPFRILGADVRGFQECAHGALGRDRIAGNKLLIRSQQAAVILRPRAILRPVHDDVPNLPGP
jgi:hypothetical protein